MMPPERKVIPIRPEPLAAVAGEGARGVNGEMISLYASHETIYPRSVSGLFSRCRWAMVVLTQLVF